METTAAVGNRATDTETADARATDTKDRILDAAEELFIEHGFAATSLRAIATQAVVNLAATNYHFGSKDGLLAAVLHRNVHPVNEERLTRLQALEERGIAPTLRQVLEALFYPLRTNLSNKRFPALMGRIFSEPESVTRPIIEQEFAEISSRFIHIISNVLPELPVTLIERRFHLMIGSMIHLLRSHAPNIGVDSTDAFGDEIEILIDYSIAGLSATKETQSD